MQIAIYLDMSYSISQAKLCTYLKVSSFYFTYYILNPYTTSTAMYLLVPEI